MMLQRLRQLAASFAAHFETILQQEFAKIDVADCSRRSGVLVPRGVVGPPLVAFWKAAGLALRARPIAEATPIERRHGHAVHGGLGATRLAEARYCQSAIAGRAIISQKIAITAPKAGKPKANQVQNSR